MKIRLNVVAGPDRGRGFDLDSGCTLVVGRGEQSDTQINDPSVSRIHFQITNNGDSILVKDRGSSSGTFVGGNRIETMEAKTGSIIQAGDSELRINLPETGENTLPPGRHAEPATSVKPLSQLVGSQLGPYKLDSIIGKGNSGMVFKAHDAEKDRIAAVKVLTPQFTSDDEQRQRFVRAMKTMLPIKHDRIVRLYNAGKTGPYCWAAMEYVDGENLSQEIKRIGIEGMMDWKQVWRVAVDIAQALDAGFEHKIVHRNVTPTNILRRKSDGVCLLGDFMLAKALEGTLAQQLTQPGDVLGEVSYLAPERTKADAEVDTRSDMYGLGATCYALLTGRPPTRGDSLVEMIKNVREQKPEPPKKYQLSINDLFQDVVMKLIAKSPNDRYDRPSSLLKELMKIGNFNNLDPGI